MTGEKCQYIPDTSNQKPELEYFVGIFYEPIMFYHIPVFPLLLEVLCVGTKEDCERVLDTIKPKFDESKETAYQFSQQLRVFERRYYKI